MKQREPPLPEARSVLSRECYDKIKNQDMKKGDVLGVARIAGIMGAKKTSELIPLCHILNLTFSKQWILLCRKRS